MLVGRGFGIKKWALLCLMVGFGCGKTGTSPSSNSTLAQQGNQVEAVGSGAKTGTTYTAANAAASCLPPPSPASTLPSDANRAPKLSKADLSNLSATGVLGAGFHNYYKVVTLTGPLVAGRIVALHLWIDKAGQDTVGQAYTRAATVSVSVAGSSSAECATTWYPATATYTLSQPLESDNAETAKAVGSYVVSVDNIGTGSGLFNASMTTTLPVGVDIDACSQTTVGTLPDGHSNTIAPSGPASNSNVASPAATAFDSSRLSYFFYYVTSMPSCASGSNCPMGYSVYGALTDDPNFCDKITRNADSIVFPSSAKYLQIGVDGAEWGPVTIPLGISTVEHSTNVFGHSLKLNLPTVGALPYQGSYQVNIQDPNTAQFLSYDFTFDPSNSPFKRTSGYTFTSLYCANLAG